MTLNSDANFEQTLTLWFQKWHEELGELSIELPKVWKLYIDGLFLFKAYKYLDEKVQKSYVSWLKSDAKFEEKPSYGSKPILIDVLPIL